MLVLPSSVLFCCTMNEIRSPMAEGIMKRFHGTQVFVDSAGLRQGRLDPLMVEVMGEIGIDMSRHKPKIFASLADDSFDMAIALSPEAQAAAIVDPRPFAAPDYAAVYAQYPHLGPVLPALGYTGAQLEALRKTINAAPVDVVVAATPIDLAGLVRVNKPVVRARYEFAETGAGGLTAVVESFLERSGLAAREE